MTNTRVLPLEAPFARQVENLLGRMMPKEAPVPPLALFRVLARHIPLADRMVGLGSYLLGKKVDRDERLPSRVRELAILRTTSRCGCEYEWGVHAMVFASRVGVTAAQLEATVLGDAQSACWSQEDAAVIACVDALHDGCRVPEPVWAACRRFLGPEQLLELVVVIGWYRVIAYVANSAELAPEAWAARFPAAAAPA